MTQHEPVVQHFYQTIVRWCIIRKSVGAATLWIFIWGTAVLVLRATQAISPLYSLLGLIGFPIALVLAVRSARRQLPELTTVRAHLDNLANCGGLLMTHAELATEQWAETMPAVSTPRVLWKGSRPLAILAISVLYLLLGLLLPIDPSAFAGEARLDVQRETERLEDQVRLLKEEKILDPERAETLKEKLNQLRDDSAAKHPAKTLEALDHLSDLLKDAAQNASKVSAREANRLSKIETAAEALREAAAELDAKATAELLAQLAAMAQQAAAEDEKFRESLEPNLADELSNGRLTPDQLSKLSEAARHGKESLQQTARKLFDNKLIDAAQLKACNCDGKNNAKELAEFLKKNGGMTALGDALDALASQCEGGSMPGDGESSLWTKDGMNAEGDKPGRGGVTEGPGAAAIQFGDKSTENGTKFHELALPPGDLAALKESQLTGVSIAAPQRNPNSGPPRSGALNGAMAGGGSANTGQILPQHKGAVERYFDRSRK